MFDVPCELDDDFDNESVFRRITELPALEEVHFSAERRFDDRQRVPTSKKSYGSSWQHQMSPQARRPNSAFSQRFSSSSYWKNQSSRPNRNKFFALEFDDE